MKLIIGLGNPGLEYKDTRHNAGFLVAEALNTKIRSTKSEFRNKSKILIFKSQNFMNESGSFVKNLVDKYELDLSDLYIIHDDLDIPLGSYKIQFGVGPKVHNGVNSVENELGSKDFWRIRVGIENRNLESGISNLGKDYVLQDFTDEERKVLDGVIEKICKETNSLLQ